MNISEDTFRKVALIKKLFEYDGKKLYDYQGKCAIYIDSYKKIIINKSRQVGISDLFSAYGLIDSSYSGNVCLVVSPSQRQSINLMNYAYNWLPILHEHIKIRTTEETKASIAFDNGGRFLSLPNSSNTVRGYRANRIILDEFAHFLHGTDKEMWTAIFPSISRGGSIALPSTPFGTENMYYEIWNNVNNFYDDWNKLLINWQDCKDLDAKEILKIKQSDDITYGQEYNNQFIEDIDEAEFPFSLIKRCINMELDYENLSKKKIYLAGCDIGRRRDLTAIAIFERKGERYILRHVETHLNKKYRWQESHIRNFLKTFTFEKFTIDATGIGNQLAEDLHEDFGDVVEPLIFDNENKQEMVLDLKNMMHENKVEIPNDPQVINNIRAIKRQYTSATGLLRFDADRTSEIGHADLFWGIALALFKMKMGTSDFYIG